MKNADYKKYYDKQVELSDKKGWPIFIPGLGACFCGHNIFEDESTREKAGHSPITGCPFCSRSYCD